MGINKTPHDLVVKTNQAQSMYISGLIMKKLTSVENNFTFTGLTQSSNNALRQKKSDNKRNITPKVEKPNIKKGKSYLIYNN